MRFGRYVTWSIINSTRNHHKNSRDVFQQILFINGSLDCTFNILLLLTIMLTSPLFARYVLTLHHAVHRCHVCHQSCTHDFYSVGSLLTIPLSILADRFLKNNTPSPLAFVGAACIVIGFIGLNIAEYLGIRAEKRKAVVEISEDQ